jgi:hypothetical protein
MVAMRSTASGESRIIQSCAARDAAVHRFFDLGEFPASGDNGYLLEQRIIMTVSGGPLFGSYIFCNHSIIGPIVRQDLNALVGALLVNHVIFGTRGSKIIVKADPRNEPKPTLGHQQQRRPRLWINRQFGAFGVLVTRHPLSKAMFRNTIELWSGQRRCILAINDADLELMVEVFESKQRQPIEVLKRTYIEFRRACPS